jgi:predicted HicB family RNase H-like nuclease
MNHKGYLGEIWMDEDARVFRGKVVNILDTVTFQGKTFDEVNEAFRDSVEDYLEFCESRGEDADRPFSGRIPLRVTPEVHRALSIAAKVHNVSLNAFVGSFLNQITQRARVKQPKKRVDQAGTESAKAAKVMPPLRTPAPPYRTAAGMKKNTGSGRPRAKSKH